MSAKMMTEELGADYYDWFYAQGPQKNKQAGPAAKLVRYPSLLRALRYAVRFPQKPDGVVEFGCGTGPWAEILAKASPNIDYLGLDISQVAIDVAAGRLCDYPNYHFSCFNINNWSSELFWRNGATWPPDNFVMCYVALEVLEHIEKDRALLARLPRGATVIFSVPNFDSHAHVRYFPRFTDVLKRYGEQLQFVAATKQQYPSGWLRQNHNSIFTVLARVRG